MAKDGLLVVKRDEPLAPLRECIIVPLQVLDGLLTVLYFRLSPLQVITSCWSLSITFLP